MAFGKSPYGYTTQPVSPYYNPQMGQGGYSYGQQPFGAYTPNSAAQMPMQNATPNSATPSSQPARTNMVFVTSLEDALQKTNMPNCNLLFLHQDKPLIFNIISDEMGRKTYTTYELVEYKDQKTEEEPKEPPKEYVTKEEFAEYQKATIASINKLKSIIINESAPTPTMTVKPTPAPKAVVTKVEEKGGEE